MQIGVLLNHYEPHQVPHVVPFAFALSRLRPDWQVTILCSSAAEEVFTRDIARSFPGERTVVERLRVPLHARLIDPLIRNIAFYRKRAVLRANLGRLAALDALLVPEITSLALKGERGLGELKLIFTGHGSGDLYSNPFGMFDERVDRFDLVVLQGYRIARALQAAGRLQSAPWGVAGYPKYEIAPHGPAKLFDNDLPVVLYNPTQNPKGTSWHRFGPAVLEHFAARDDLNLLFAPHALLFKRAWTRGARLPSHVCDGPRLKVDLGSRASFDLTYLMAADLYLGDQSSQIYEFISRPRPCVFLNAGETGWQGNPDFRSWTFGPVVERIEDLGPAIGRAFAEFDTWRGAQEAALADDAPEPGAPFAETPASERGARIIAEFLETGGVSDTWR